MKSIFASAYFLLLSTVSLFCLASSNLGVVYAKLNVNAQHSEEQSESFTEIRSNNSWIGIKGEVPAEEGITAVYRLEWKVDITGEGNESLTERPQYVGVRSKLGEVTLGRHFTALWMAQGRSDLFNQYEGDIKTIWAGENRLSDVATYTSPSYQKFRLIGTYQAEKMHKAMLRHPWKYFTEIET